MRLLYFLFGETLRGERHVLAEERREQSGGESRGPRTMGSIAGPPPKWPQNT